MWHFMRTTFSERKPFDVIGDKWQTSHLKVSFKRNQEPAKIRREILQAEIKYGGL